MDDTRSPRQDFEDFDEFAAAAWPQLRRTAYLLTGDPHLAEDLAQAALVRTFASWRRVRRGDALAYTRKALVNLNIDRHRRRARRVGEVPLDDRAGLAHAGQPGVRTSHDGVDDRDEIVRALARLTERERRVVVLRHYYDLSEADVADELGIALGTVKSTNARALAKLRVDTSAPTGTSVR